MKKLLAAVAAAACALAAGLTACTQPETPGTYSVEAELSCYISAMGGIEFGKPLLERTEYTVAEDGSLSITLHLIKSSVKIFSIECFTFVDADPPETGINNKGSLKNGTIGIYDGDGSLVTEGVSYTLSEDTATNNTQEEVHYVDSITLPVEEKRQSYMLALCIDSQVMGAQFAADSYEATLTVDWDTASAAGEAE